MAAIGTLTSLFFVLVNPLPDMPILVFSCSAANKKQEDHDGPISLTWVLSSEGQQSHVPTCGPRGRASFEPRGIKSTNLVEVH